MAISLSTCLVNRLAGQEVTVTDTPGTAIDFTTGTITTTSSDFLTQGFRPGQVIKIASSTSNDGYVTATQVAAATITISETITAETGIAGTTLSVPNGLNWVTIFKHGIMDIYSSPMPANADLAETGTKLLSLTDGAGAFTAGESTNGLQFEFDAAGVFGILSTQTWQDAGIATGTAYYARLYDNAYITGLDSVNLQSPRIQGRVGTSGQDFDITSTSIVIAVTNTCDTLNFTQPKVVA